MKDEEIMDKALKRFNEDARKKFMEGVREHNPDGTKGLSRMTLEEKLRSCLEEGIDLWFYLYVIEEKCLS